MSLSPCTPDVVLGEGGGQSQSGTARDLAGNENSTTVRNLNVDKTPPVVLLALPSDSTPEFLQQQVVLADWSASDELSGLASAAGTLGSGLPLDTSAAGVQTFAVRALDLADNETVVQHSYLVLAPVDSIGKMQSQLQDLVSAGTVREKDDRKWLRHLDKALEELSKDKVEKACHQLEDFEKKLDKDIPKKISFEAAAGLIQLAESIRTISLGCQ